MPFDVSGILTSLRIVKYARLKEDKRNHNKMEKAMVLKRVLIFSLAVLMATLLVSEAFAGGYSVSGIGVRARGMAGAFRAVADDWSAAYYNPAGLAKIEQSQLNLTLDFNSYRPSYDLDVSYDDYTFGFPAEERYPDDIVTYFPNFSGIAVAPFGFPFNVGFAMFEPYDENLRWDLYRFPEGYDSLQGKLPGIDFRNNLDVLDFHPTIARSFSDDRLHVGLGLSIRRGDIYTCQVYLVDSPFDPPFNARPYDRLAKWAVTDVYGLGYGFNLGVLFDLNETISIGASYQSKTTINMDGNVTTRLYTPNNVDLKNHAREIDTLGSGWTAYDIEELDTLFSGYSLEGYHEVDADMTLPSEFGIGIAIHPSEYVTLAADFTFTKWSEFEYADMKVKKTQEINSHWKKIAGILSAPEYPCDWDDAIRISLGIEAQPNDRFKIRGGYSFDQSPVPDEEASPLITDTGDRHHLSGGASYVYNMLEFSFAAGLMAMPERDVTDLSDINNDGVWDNLSGTYNNTDFNTSFSVTLRF